jgi:hypothetical protein
MKKSVFFLLLFIITSVGLVFRFWHYGQRFGLAYDQAHDALVARSALSQGKIPLLGPFSSAGPFQTSGTWYWLIMAGTAIYPKSVQSPWIYLTVLCCLTIVLMGLLGVWLENEWFGLLLALLTAISTAQIAQSVNLTNQTPIAFFAVCSIMCSFCYVKTRRVIAAFGMAFFASWAASIHLQGVALALLVLVTFLFSKKFSFPAICAAIVGALPPMLPILLYDMSHQYINIKNMLYYYRVDQYRISLDVLNRRWSTYLTSFWPTQWAHIIGGNIWIAMGISVLACILFVYFLVKRNIGRVWIVIFVTFACMTVLVRYTRTPLFASFIVFTHPFVLLISAWVIYQVFRFQKIIGSILLSIIVLFSINASVQEMRVFGNLSTPIDIAVRNMLVAKYPNETFSLYDWKYSTSGLSLPMVLYLDAGNLSSDSGRRIGVMRSEEATKLSLTPIATFSATLVDLSASDSAHLQKAGWHDVNPNAIYHQTEDWQE